MDQLPVISTCFNPWGYETIYRNFSRFAEQMAARDDVLLLVAEVAFADRPFRITLPDDRHVVRLRTHSPIWVKEVAQNVGRQHLMRLYPEAEKVAFVDGDVEFLAHDWPARVLASLDHHAFIQPWSEAIYGGPQDQLDGIVTSFMSQYVAGVEWTGHPPVYGSMWHPGFATAWRLDALDRIGGLLDLNLVGGADLEMALGLIGRMDAALDHQGIGHDCLPAYRAAVLAWQDRAERIVQRNVGVVEGLIRHHHHGSQKGRQYESRYRIPLDHAYDPTRDIVRNPYGLYEWAPHVVGMKYDLRGMFARRGD